MQQANKTKLELFDASNYKVGIVCANFNNDITDQVLQNALEELEKFKVKNIKVNRVAGCVEIPTVLQVMAQSKLYDGLISIGAIIKGETDHYDYVAKMVSEGALRVMLDNSIPVGFAVLTTQNRELAEKRVEIGAEAVSAILHSTKILRNI